MSTGRTPAFRSIAPAVAFLKQDRARANFPAAPGVSTGMIRLLPLLLLALLRAAPAAAQEDTVPAPRQGLVTREELLAARLRAAGISTPDPYPRRPVSEADSLAWERAREAAARATGRRVVVSLFERRLWLIDGADTLLSAPAGIGRGKVTDRSGRTWDFSTPRGRRRVLAKEKDPVWVPPDWHYVEMAQREGRGLAHLRRGRETPLGDGSRLAVRGDAVVRLHPGGRAEPLPPDAPLVFGDTLYAPPLGTAHRRIPGTLGAYKLDTGDGYLIHGTPEWATVGFASTHGCIRLDDADLEILYRAVPVGTPVYVY